MFCSRFNATIYAKTCINRQKINRQNHVSSAGKRGVTNHAPFPACVGCEQGKEIRRSKGIDLDMDVEQLKEMHGQSKPFVMQEVAKPEKAYKKRSAVSQVQGDAEEQPVVAENAIVAHESRTCPHHPDRPQTVHKDGRYSGLCRECVLSRLKKASGVISKRAKLVKKMNGMNEDEAVVLDFRNHPELRDWLESSAKENLREIDKEIIFKLIQVMREIGNND